MIHPIVRPIIIASMTAIGFAACSVEGPNESSEQNEGGATSASTSSTSAGTGGDGGAPDPAAPRIESFAASHIEFTPNGGDEGEQDQSSTDMMTFTAVVTDPDGQGDITGGILTDEEGHPFGTFLKSGGGSSYIAELAWSAFVTSSGVSFDAGGTNFNFVAVFSDAAGHETSASVTVALSCGWDELALCDGQCMQLIDDDNCGACGVSCNCENGHCVEYTCGTGEGTISCNDICTNAGLTCSATFCEAAGYFHQDAVCGERVLTFDSCATSTVGDGNSFECCCV